MKAVRKYEMHLAETEFSMPTGASVLGAQAQRETVCLWALVDPEERGRVIRKFTVIGTGHAQPEGRCGHYIGTVQTQEGACVLHVFEVGR